MKKIKCLRKIGVSLLLVVIMLLGTMSLSMAMEEVPCSAENTSIPIIEVSPNASQEEINEAAERYIHYGSTRYFMIRSGDTEECELYINWSGNHQNKSWSYGDITIKNSSTGKVYKTVEQSTTIVVAATSGSFVVCYVNIPISETKVNVDTDYLKSSCLICGPITYTEIPRNVVIN